MLKLRSQKRLTDKHDYVTVEQHPFVFFNQQVILYCKKHFRQTSVQQSRTSRLNTTTNGML